MTRFLLPLLMVVAAITCFATGSNSPDSGAASSRIPTLADALRARLTAIADTAPARVGIAVILPDGDTLTVNNNDDYRLMSVFKLHQAIAVAHALDLRGISLDTVILIDRANLDSVTWSPMYLEHPEAELRLSVAELLRYTLQLSDNNASNLLFDRIASVQYTDSFIRRATGIEDFRLRYTEHQMHRLDASDDSNRSTPMACARLIEKIFTDSLVTPGKQEIIRRILLGCRTGLDRIYVPLAGEEGVSLAHKTGSGFRTPDGILRAHNDVGRITLPGGRAYTLAVLVRDYRGSDAQASALIADISRTLYRTLAIPDFDASE